MCLELVRSDEGDLQFIRRCMLLGENMCGQASYRATEISLAPAVISFAQVYSEMRVYFEYKRSR